MTEVGLERTFLTTRSSRDSLGGGVVAVRGRLVARRRSERRRLRVGILETEDAVVRGRVRRGRDAIGRRRSDEAESFAMRRNVVMVGVERGGGGEWGDGGGRTLRCFIKRERSGGVLDAWGCAVVRGKNCIQN